MNQQITTTRREPELPVGEVAKYFVQSGMFPDTKQLATAATKLIVGRGLGLSDYDCMGGLHIIQGKAVLASNAMSAAIKASGKYEYRVVEQSEEKCVIDFYMVNGGKLGDKIGSTTWTMEKAKRAGLNGQNWKKYPEAMLFARAISEGYRTHCPDALGCSAPVYVEAHGESEIPGREPQIVDTTATVVEEQIEKRKNKEIERMTLQGRHIESVENASSGQYKWFIITVEGDDRKFTTFSQTMSKVARSAKHDKIMCDVEVVLNEKPNGDQYWNLAEIEATQEVV
tara:strand:+ start:4248 stop:5099 length:852 start_codon:yes stop_codon:yes gene_type:complete